MRLALAVLLALPGCASDPTPVDVTPLRGAAPAVEPAGPVLKRLTQTQYANTIHDLFGADVVVPDNLEPDAPSEGLLQVGAGVNALSAYGVERYEDAAYSVAEQALGDEAARARLVPCAAAGPQDDACARTVLDALGRLAWRRSLTADESDRLVGLTGVAGVALGDFDEGLACGIAALLQSPNFVYRVELGEEDPGAPGLLRYTDSEMATRLAYFLWNTTPDEALLTAADAGELTTDAGLAAQLDRMLADPRSEDGLRAFFGDMLTLYELDELNKDPTVFVHMSADVGPAAREETLQGLTWLVSQDGDYRDLFTTRTAFLDRKLAAIYGVPAPSPDGFAQTELPDDGRRRGILGQVSFLALQSHAANTSVTRRGLFVREVLLCQSLPSPPAGLNTSIPEATDAAPTMRDRVAQHLADPSCAGCHLSMDPIGLGLENFDGLGGWRDSENGVVIDASGDLDGVAYADAWALGQALHDHPNTGPCLARTLFQYAGGHLVAAGETELLDWHAQGFAEAGYSVQFLLRDLVASPGFRTVGAPE